MTKKEIIEHFNQEGGVINMPGIPTLDRYQPGLMIVSYVGTKQDTQGKEHLWFYSGGDKPHFGPPVDKLEVEQGTGALALKNQRGETVWEMIDFEFAYGITRGQAIDAVADQRGEMPFKQAEEWVGDPAENGSFAGFAPGWEKE